MISNMHKWLFYFLLGSMDMRHDNDMVTQKFEVPVHNLNCHSVMLCQIQSVLRLSNTNMTVFLKYPFFIGLLMCNKWTLHLVCLSEVLLFGYYGQEYPQALPGLTSLPVILRA